MYKIVVFKEQNTVEYVPISWVIGFDQCYWPKKKINVIKRLISEKVEPDESWPIYDIRLIGKAGKKFNLNS